MSMTAHRPTEPAARAPRATAPLGDALVSVRDLTRTFDVSDPWLNRVIERKPKRILTAVDDVSFDIRRGSTFALVGESGSGKSTVAKLVTGLLKPTRGTVTFEGVNVHSDAFDSSYRRRTQMIFQDPFASLNPRWRVDAIVAEPLQAFGLAKGADVNARVTELLSTVGLARADGAKYPHEFSGGQRQRVGIARALASNPEFLVCDEPTSALDVSVQAQILNLMRDLQDELGLTYLFISHDLSVVRHMADTIGVMYLGRLVETAGVEPLRDAPKHPYTEMLFDAVPTLDDIGRARVPVTGEVPSPIDPPSGCPFHPRCPIVIERCRTDKPAVRDVAGHAVACHRADEVAPDAPVV